MNWFKMQCSLFKITLKVNNIYTTIYVVLRIALGLLPSFYIIAYTKFINNILKLYSGTLNPKQLLPSFLLIILLSLLKYLSGNLINFISMKLKIEMLEILKLESIEKRSRLKYELIENNDSWDLIHRTVKGIPEEISKGFFNLFDLVELIIKIVSITVIIGTFSYIVAGIILVCFIPIIFVSIRSGEKDYDSFIKFQKVQRRIDNYENVLISKDYVDERTIFNYSLWFIDKWKSSYEKATNIFLGVKKKNYTKVKITSLTITTIFLGIIVILMKLTVTGIITIGLFTATVMQLLELGSKISWTLTSIIYQLANTNSYMKDYFKFYDLEETPYISNSIKISDINNIEFQNVSFKYPGNKDYTLKNVNLKIESNKNYAFVGENGAGKSTIIKLILKLYDGYEGKILINGVDLKNIDNLSSLLSVVFQDYAKYEITLMENVFFDNKDNVDSNKILRLFDHLNFSIDSNRFAKGLNTELGRLTNQNTDISIGQWQKISMIRAIAQRGNYYILDEPTAALDPVAEATLYKDFMKIVNKNSSIIITHRLGAARLADEIIVINNGTIAQVGSHNELMTKGGLYKEMYDNQRSWYIDEETEFC